MRTISVVFILIMLSLVVSGQSDDSALAQQYEYNYEIIQFPSSTTINHYDWSPDGEKIAFTGRCDSHYNIFRVDVETGDYSPICFDMPNNVEFLSWSINNEIAFDGLSGGSKCIWKVNADGGYKCLLIEQGYHRVDSTFRYYMRPQHPLWKEDGNQLIIYSYFGYPDDYSRLFTYNIVTDSFSHLFYNGHRSFPPYLHPTINTIIFNAVWEEPGDSSIWLTTIPDTGGTAQTFVEIGNTCTLNPPSISADSTKLIFAEHLNPYGIYIYDLTSSILHPIQTPIHNPREPKFSPSNSQQFAFITTGNNLCIATENSSPVNDRPIKASEIKVRTYPNPFNNKVNFEFNLNHPARVKIIIYDLFGREVERIHCGQLHNNKHTLAADFRENLSSGIYYYKISIDDISHSGKLLYLK